LQRRSQPIDPIGKSQNIEKIGLTTNFVSSLLVWLRYELFRGRLSDAAFQRSELSLLIPLNY
jgi:hypothetical protein